VVRDADYQIIARHLYKLGADNILRSCVMEHEHPIILAEAHEGTDGGHYARKSNMLKILCVGIWWPTVSKYAKEYFHTCDVYHRVGKTSRRYEMPPQP
jgi:hypothetical protein